MRQIWITLVIAACGIVSSRAAAKSEIRVFEAGRILLPVVVAGDAPVEEKTAAAELARVLGVMSGLDWPLLNDAPQAAGFHVGGGPHAGLLPNPGEDPLEAFAAGRGPDSFSVRTGAGKVMIMGATPEATGHAVAWLLQEHAGVRWYAPGELGEVIPRRTAWSLPALNRVVSPAYFSRELHGEGLGAGSTWAVRHGLRGRLEFGHALSRVFAPEVMAAHPEWQPVVRGKRLQPTNGSDRHWQPNLALPAVAAHVAQSALDAFAREPDRVSFSLGMNDTLRFDQSDYTEEVVAPMRWFRSMPDYSPLVFGFMNRAAHDLSAVRPDRYLGGLAYLWCENPPSFPVHPQVLPYVTTDRSQYYDDSYRAGDLALMSRWQASGVRTFGLWEYAYGGGFLVPRMATAALAESVREGWQRGARGYFAEVEPHPGFDTFKTWMLARLLWNPEHSVTDLREDFLSGCYGEAAPPMRAFFDRCEKAWMEQSGPPYWLKFYRQEDQALLFPEEVCRELRSLLTDALRLGDDARTKARIELTSRAFAVTEAYARFHHLRSDLTSMTQADAGAASENELARKIGELVQSRRDFMARLEEACDSERPAMTRTNPESFLANDPVPRLLWQLGQRDALAPARVLAQAGAEVSSVCEWLALAEVAALGQTGLSPELAVNGSFAELALEPPEPRFLYPHFDNLPADWEWNAAATEDGRVRVVDPADGDRFRAVRIEGAWDTQIYQWVRAKPGTIYVARAGLRGLSRPGGDASLYFTFLTADGRVAGTHHLQSLPKGTVAGWRESVLVDRAPADAAWVGIGFGASRQVAGDWVEVRTVSLKESTVGTGS